jgi:hypothetical protein
MDTPGVYELGAQLNCGGGYGAAGPSYTQLPGLSRNTDISIPTSSVSHNRRYLRSVQVPRNIIPLVCGRLLYVWLTLHVISDTEYPGPYPLLLHDVGCIDSSRG